MIYLHWRAVITFLDRWIGSKAERSSQEASNKEIRVLFEYENGIGEYRNYFVRSLDAKRMISMFPFLVLGKMENIQVGYFIQTNRSL